MDHLDRGLFSRPFGMGERLVGGDLRRPRQALMPGGVGGRLASRLLRLPAGLGGDGASLLGLRPSFLAKLTTLGVVRNIDVMAPSGG